MNKVMNIRLGNYILTVDEDAAAAIGNYTDALRRRYAAEEGAQEIVSDIEERMGELLDKKQKENNRNYSTLEDVQAVISQMGPVDNGDAGGFASESGETRRRLYRDPDNKILGGVWAGLAAYFDIDPVIPRIIWLISVLTLGFGIPLYIILWVVIPEAKTTAEKLMMRGQRPTLRNIEDNVRSELNEMGQRFNNPKNRDRFTEFLRNLVIYTGKFVFAVVKWAIATAGLALVACLVMVLISVTTNTIYFHDYNIVLNGQEGLNTLLSAAGDPLWIKVAVIAFILICIAWIGLVIFSTTANRSRIRAPRQYLGWASTVAFLILFVFAFDGFRSIGTRSEKTAYSEALGFSGDTLFLNANLVNTEQRGLYTLNTFTDILPSSDDEFHIEQRNITYGHNRISSSVRNEKIGRRFRFTGNQLTLEQGSRIEDLRKAGMAWVEYTLYVPRGKTVKTGPEFHFPENNYTPLSEKNRAYTMDSSGYMAGSPSGGNSIYLENSVHSISIDGKFDVQIIPAARNRIELVSGPVLHHREWIDADGPGVKIEEHNHWISDKPSFIRIYINDLQMLDLSSLAQVKFQNWKSEQLDIEAEGVAKIRGTVDIENLELDLSGTSKAELSGKSSYMAVDASGASEFEGSGLLVQKAHVQASGASHITVWATGELDGHASGASSVTAKGDPTRSNVETSGASKYKKL